MITMAKKKKPNKLVLSSAYIYSFHIKFLSSLKWRATNLEKKSTFWFKPQLSSMFRLDFMKINIYLVKIGYNKKSCIFCKAACHYANKSTLNRARFSNTTERWLYWIRGYFWCRFQKWCIPLIVLSGWVHRHRHLSPSHVTLARKFKSRRLIFCRRFCSLYSSSTCSQVLSDQH